MAYEDAGAASLLAYNFENGKLKGVVAVVSTKYTSQYASYLSERFLMLPYYKGEDSYFVGADNIKLADAKTVVLMQVYNVNQLTTMYMPVSDYITRSCQSSSDIEGRAKKLLKDFILQDSKYKKLISPHQNDSCPIHIEIRQLSFGNKWYQYYC